LAQLRGTQSQWTIIRPSVIVGAHYDIFSPVGKQLGNLLLCPGSRDRILNLVHVEDVAAAIIKLIQDNATGGRVFNLSAEAISQGAYIDNFIRQIGYDTLPVFFLPYWMARTAAGFLSALRVLSRNVPNIDKRRLVSLYRSVAVSSELVKTQTGWEPRRNLLSALVIEARTSATMPRDGTLPAGLNVSFPRIASQGRLKTR
jgi:nucleoside-diphosphate-sugar epimerase